MQEEVREEIQQMLSGMATNIVLQISGMLSATEDRLTKRLDEHDRRFDEVDMRFDQIDRRFEDVEKRFAVQDERFSKQDERFDRIERHLENHSERLETIEFRMDNFEVRMVEMRNENAVFHDEIIGFLRHAEQERVFTSEHLRRHDRQISELQQHAGIA